MGDMETTFSGVQRWLIDASAMGDAHAMLPDLVWNALGDLAQAAPSPAMVALAAQSLAERGWDVTGEIRVVRHMAGNHRLPPSPAPLHRFALDLTDAVSTFQTSQLLFVDDDGRVCGWGPRRGALTIWQGADPILAQIAPSASPRIMLLGSVTPSATPVVA